MKTLSLDIKLSNKQLDILNSLSGYTGYSPETLLTNVALGRSSWKSLAEANEIHAEANNPNIRRYTMEEVDKFVSTGIYPK